MVFMQDNLKHWATVVKETSSEQKTGIVCFFFRFLSKIQQHQHKVYLPELDHSS